MPRSRRDASARRSRGDGPTPVRPRVPLGVALAPLGPVDRVAELHDGKVPRQREGGGALLAGGERERHAHRAGEAESSRVERSVGKLSGLEGGQEVGAVPVAGPVLGGAEDRTTRPARRDHPLGALGLGHVVLVLGLEPHPDACPAPAPTRSAGPGGCTRTGRWAAGRGRWGSSTCTTPGPARWWDWRPPIGRALRAATTAGRRAPRTGSAA